MDRSDLLAPILTQRVVCVRICAHRTWAIERTHSGDIFEVIRFHQLEKVTHTATIKLENAQGITAAQQFISCWVIQRHMVKIGILLAIEFDVFKSIRNNRQVTQSQEVHLE